MNHTNEAHPQTISLAIGQNINKIDLDLKNVQRIKAELKEIQQNCKAVLKQLKEVE